MSSPGHGRAHPHSLNVYSHPGPHGGDLILCQDSPEPPPVPPTLPTRKEQVGTLQLPAEGAGGPAPLLRASCAFYSLDAGVAGCAETRAGAGVAAGAVTALAWQLAALAMGARRTELLAAPTAEAGGAHAGAGDGVAQGSILALAPVAAVGSPVVAVAACKRGACQG